MLITNKYFVYIPQNLVPTNITHLIHPYVIINLGYLITLIGLTNTMMLLPQLAQI